MNKKFMLSVTILIGFFYLIDFGYARVNFGIIGAIKNKGEKLTDKVEKKREEISTSVPDETIPNNSPNNPSNPIPADGAIDQSVNVDVSWTGGDPDAGDTITYDLYFGLSTNPPLISDDQTITTYDLGTLSNRNTYYWKIVAKDNNGAFTSGPVWSFETPKIWGTAQLIENDNTGTVQYPQVAVDSTGNAIAVWHQAGSSYYNIWSNRYEEGIGWGIVQLIETNNAGNALYSQVGINSSGNAIAVWQQSEGARDNIWSNCYIPGTGWGTAQLIETDNAGNARNSQVAVDSSGNAIAVWQQWDGTRDNIWSNRYVPGAGWGIAQLIEIDDVGDAQYSQVAVDSNGNALAVWQQWDATRDNIWSNRYVPGVGWGTAQLIETDNAGNARNSQVAVDSSGNAIAVWSQNDGTRYNIWSNRYVPGTGWGTAQLIETDNSGNAYGSQVAINSNGNAIVVWHQHESTGVNIWSNCYIPGTGWGTALLIETDTGTALTPQVAVDSSGNALAVWHQSDATRYNIWSNRYVPGTGWGIAHLIESDNAGSAFYPQIGVNSNGNAIAVWQQFDGTKDNVWSNRYE